MVINKKSCFLDTGVFYRTTEHLRELVEANCNFFINSIVFYEFLNTMEEEINKAKEKKNNHRIKLLKNLQLRFSEILSALDVSLLDTPTDWNRTVIYLDKMNKLGINIGDVMILETIIHHNIDLIVSTDKDWKRTNINCLII